jgi:hypothetical protein
LIESPGFDQVGRVNFYLKKIQNGVVLEKKQKSTGCNWVTRSTCRVGRVMIFPIFLLTRPGSSLGSQVDPPGRAGFQNYDFTP